MPLAKALDDWDHGYLFFAPKRFPVDESQVASLLDTLTPDEIDAAAEELHAYARHRRVHGHHPVGAAAAPFNFGQFLKNFIKVLKVVYPVVGPLIGLDPTVPATSASPE